MATVLARWRGLLSEDAFDYDLLVRCRETPPERTTRALSLGPPPPRARLGVCGIGLGRRPRALGSPRRAVAVAPSTAGAALRWGMFIVSRRNGGIGARPE